MRKLVWFTLGFAASCAFFTYGRAPLLLVLPLIVLLLPLVTKSKRKEKTLLSLLGVILGLTWCFRFEAAVLKPVHALDGQTAEASIRCDTYPVETDYGLRTEGTIRLGNRDYGVLCYLKPDTEIAPGMILSGSFRFRVTAPGASADSVHYQGRKIFLLAYPRGTVTVTQDEKNWQDHAQEFRQKLLVLLEAALPRDAAQFARALLLGDSTGLDYETLTDLTVSGIRHIVAVSGLHVAILFSLVNDASFRRRTVTAILLAPVLVVFAAMTGFTPSVSRACIMSGLMLLAGLVKRVYDAPSALCVAALVLLVGNPLAVASGSFQLSFASVAGIFLFSTRLRGWFYPRLRPRLPESVARYLTVSLSVTLGATVLTVPLSALQFGAFSLVSLVTNILALWVVSFLFYGLVGLCIVSLFWPAAVPLLAVPVTALIRYILICAGFMADFPLASVYTRSHYITLWLIFVYVLLVLWQTKSRRIPEALCGCLGFSLCLALAASWAEPMMDDTRITVLDVGHGQSILLQTEGRNFLIDCGGSTDAMAADAAAEALLSQGISRLDGFIITHSDSDHAGGAGELLTRVSTELLILPAVWEGEDLPAGETVYASEELLLTAGTAKIHIYPAEAPSNDNENSLCILFDGENCDILVTGDRSGSGEMSLLEHTAIPDVDVLIAGHHGSKLATSEELLHAARPEIVCISAGDDNAFGHPAPELLERLEAFGCTVYRTDLQGDIIIRR